MERSQYHNPCLINISKNAWKKLITSKNNISKKLKQKRLL